MRIAAGLIFASTISLLLSGAAWSQTPPAAKGAAAQAAAAPKAAAGSAPAAAAPAAARRVRPTPRRPAPIPNALGVGRTVEIDTTGGPGFGFEHFKQLDFLRDKEVVLTFDDGPWPVQYAGGSEDARRRMHHGHLLPDRQARHLLSGDSQAGLRGRPHRRLAHLVARRSGNKKLTDDQRKDEIEKGFSAVKWALGGTSPAPFFRFPALQHPPEMVTYLGKRNIAIFSCDLDSFDFKASKPQT